MGRAGGRTRPAVSTLAHHTCLLTQMSPQTHTLPATLFGHLLHYTHLKRKPLPNIPGTLHHTSLHMTVLSVQHLLTPNTEGHILVDSKASPQLPLILRNCKNHAETFALYPLHVAGPTRLGLLQRLNHQTSLGSRKLPQWAAAHPPACPSPRECYGTPWGDETLFWPHVSKARSLRQSG